MSEVAERLLLFGLGSYYPPLGGLYPSLLPSEANPALSGRWRSVRRGPRTSETVTVSESPFTLPSSG